LPAPPLRTVRSPWIATLILTAVYTVHSVDRYLIAAVIEPIRREFHLTDTQLGALGGLAHAIAFAVCVLPIGWLLDRVNRVKLLSIMLTIWSAITALGALATGYGYIFMVRMGVGAAESASAPASQSLIASLFPVRERASALGVVFSGLAIGTGLAFAIGGAITDTWGWRAVFLVAGIPGMLLAAFMWFFLQEPARTHAQEKAAAAAPPMWKVLAFVGGSPAVLLTILGLTIATMSSASIWVWTTPVLVRQHGMSLTEAGLVVGIAGGLVKFISTFGAGFLADWLARGRVDRLWVVPASALFLSAPVCFAMGLVQSKPLVIGLVWMLGLTMGAHYSSPKATIATVTPSHMRGSVAAVQELMLNLIGGGVGPLLTGFVSDLIGGRNSAGRALGLVVSLNILAALCFFLASRWTRPLPEASAN
jgi:predicted MFS family arabinose efflux permease